MGKRSGERKEFKRVWEPYCATNVQICSERCGWKCRKRRNESSNEPHVTVPWHRYSVKNFLTEEQTLREHGSMLYVYHNFREVCVLLNQLIESWCGM